MPTRIRSLSRPAGEGWGEGGSCPLCRISASHPHPNLPPPDGGRDQVAVTERGRLKNLFRAFQTTYLHSDTLNPLSLQYDGIRGQSPRYTVGQRLKLEKTHSGIFCVDLWDNNRSVGFAHENSPLSRSAGEGWGEDGSCPLCCISANHLHPNLPPPDGGRDQIAVTEKDRLKTLFQVFRRSCIFDGFDDGNLERNCFCQNFTRQVFGRQVGFALQRPFDADGQVVPNQ